MSVHACARTHTHTRMVSLLKSSNPCCCYRKKRARKSLENNPTRGLWVIQGPLVPLGSHISVCDMERAISMWHSPQSCHLADFSPGGVDINTTWKQNKPEKVRMLTFIKKSKHFSNENWLYWSLLVVDWRREGGKWETAVLGFSIFFVSHGAQGLSASRFFLLCE